MQLQAKEHQRLPVSNTNQKEAGSIYAFRGRMDMPSPLFQTFGLPHCDRINFFFFFLPFLFFFIFLFYFFSFLK